MPLLFLFILIPVIEITLFITIGDIIGLGWTIFSVFATAFIGTNIMRKQGLAAWKNAQSQLQENRLPMEEVFTALCLLVAGAFLLTPGFLTDAIGFTLLIPPFRRSLGKTIWRWINKKGHIQNLGPNPSGQNAKHPFGDFTQDDVIDGDFTVINPTEKTSQTSSMVGKKLEDNVKRPTSSDLSNKK